MSSAVQRSFESKRCSVNFHARALASTVDGRYSTSLILATIGQPDAVEPQHRNSIRPALALTEQVIPLPLANRVVLQRLASAEVFHFFHRTRATLALALTTIHLPTVKPKERL